MCRFSKRKTNNDAIKVEYYVKLNSLDPHSVTELANTMKYGGGGVI